MARDRITAVVLRDDRIEWTTWLSKGGGKVARFDRLSLTAPEAVEPDTAAASEADATEPGEALKTACAPLKGHTVVGALATEHLLLRVVELPVTDADELAGMVALQVDKFSPFPVENMVVSHEVLQRDEEVCVVLIAAVKKEVVQAYGDRLRQAEIHPERVDAVIMGWWSILSNSGKIGAAGRQVFLFLDGPDIETIVTQDGCPILFRSIAGLDVRADARWAEEMATEVAHTLMSLELEHGGGAGTRLVLWTRRDVEPSPLVQALETECDARVEAVSLEDLPPVSEGLARRAAPHKEWPRLDLTPAAWREQEAAARFKRHIVVFAASALLVWVLGVTALLGGLAYERQTLARLGREFARGHAEAQAVDDMRRRVALVERYVDVDTSALESLRAISLVQPRGIELNSFSYRKGEGVRIAGDSDGVNQVYEFKNRLDENGGFLESNLIGPRRDSRRGKDIFEIVLRLPGDEE